MTGALGLIEVIGYPTAIEAADAALKAASVQLNGIVKVDGGIMTVQILGDVGAVKSAVDAAAMAAERVGKVVATHVIPKVDESLYGTVIKLKAAQAEAVKETEARPEIEIKRETQAHSKIEIKKEADAKQEIEDKQKIEAVKEIEETPENKQPTLEDLQNMSNKALKNLIASLGIKVAEKKLKSAKKEELIKILKDFYKL